MNRNFYRVVLCLSAVSGLSLAAAEPVFEFDFEQGNGKQMPPSCRQIIDKDCGGTVDVILDKSGKYTKALKIIQQTKPEARLLMVKNIPVKKGDVLNFECVVKGTGIATFGIYGFDKMSNRMDYQTARARINSPNWQKLTQEITITKANEIKVQPFLQSSKGTVIFSALKVSIKGFQNGRWETTKEVTLLNWDAYSGRGSLTAGERENGNFPLKLNTESQDFTIAANEIFQGKSGDPVVLTFKARGKGVLTPVMLVSSKEGKKTAIVSESIPLSPQWKEYTRNLLTVNGPDFETALIRPAFRLSTNTNAEIDGISAYWKPDEYAGDLVFPRNATVFPLVNPKYMPTAEELKRIPGTLAGISGVPAELTASTLDLAPLMNGVRLKNCAWIYFSLNSPFESDYTIGAGADWWMTVYLNGKKVIDTMAGGNNGNFCNPADQLQKIRLNKGNNIIAVKFLSGQSTSLLRIGGPNDIRKYRETLLRSRVLAMDNFENRSVKRPGTPALVEQMTRFGDLTRTLVGVYHGSAELPPFNKTFSFADLQSDEMIGQSILIVDFPFSSKAKNQFTFEFSSGNKSLECTVENLNDQDLICYFSENGRCLSPRFKINNAKKMLPGDFTVYADRNGWLRLLFSSSRDTLHHQEFLWESAFFRELGNAPFTIKGRVTLADAESTMSVDEYIALTGKIKVERSRMPFLLELAPEFDPVKAGWKLVMEDQFDGTSVDLSRWRIDGPSKPGREYTSLDGKGHLLIKADWNKEKTKLETNRLWTRRCFTYGYFEARVKFTKQPGWWSAFFMMSPLYATTPFYGVEFDFFEDYYTRPQTPGGPFRKILDSTAYTGHRNLYKHPIKIWNYQSEIPGSLDEFYTFGCKWTPFEISYYLNGKLLPGNLKFSPYSTVTWDAFNHCAVACQTYMVLSGETGLGDPKQGRFPEYYVVDYFKAYEYPQDDLPQIKWADQKQEKLFVNKGDTLNFKVEVKPSAKSGAKIRGVYLFDNGYYLDKKETPPYTFSIPFTKEYYDTTQYAVPGLSKGTPMSPPVFDTQFPHTFAVFVQDEKGKVARTSIKRFILEPNRKSTPYQGNPSVIPGTVKLPFYDEGGQEVAYFWAIPGKDQTFRLKETVYATDKIVENNHSGNWLNYTVNVKKTGKYEAKLRYSCTSTGNADSWVEMYVDGYIAGCFRLQNNGRYENPKNLAILPNIELTQGQHKITLLLNMRGFLADITFKEQ